MAKKKTSSARSKSYRTSRPSKVKAKFSRVEASKSRTLDFSKLTPHVHTDSLKDPVGVLETLIECLVENDLESFREVLAAHLHVTNKSKLSRDTKIGRTTIYDLLNEDKPFNPTLETLGPLFKSLKDAA